MGRLAQAVKGRDRRQMSRGLTFGLLLLILPTFAGCAIFPVSHTGSVQSLPKPAYAANGMELVWGKDVKAKALAMIRNSHTRIDLDMYELSDPDVIQALNQAFHRHVQVQVVLDATEPHSTGTGYPALQKDGIPTELIHIKSGIDHVKMLVVDNDVLIGGMNYGSSSWENNDASVYIPHADGQFQAMFDWDFRRASGAVAQAPVTELPLVTDGRIGEAMVTAISSARKTIDMEAFDLSDRDVIDALHQAVLRGVQVSILVDPTQRTYSESGVSLLQAAGALVRYYRPYQGELMHAKIVDIDHGRTFLIGSANFSNQAYTYNHEADLELHDVPEFAAALETDLHQELARGTDDPLKEKESTWT